MNDQSRVGSWLSKHMRFEHYSIAILRTIGMHVHLDVMECSRKAYLSGKPEDAVRDFRPKVRSLCGGPLYH